MVEAAMRGKPEIILDLEFDEADALHKLLVLETRDHLKGHLYMNDAEVDSLFSIAGALNTVLCRILP